MAWGRALRLALLEHPSLPMIFLSQAVIGPGIFQGIETLLGALSRAGMPATFGLHAIYAVVIYTAGFVAWELPRTRRQPESAYAAAWRREFAGLRQEDFPFTASVLDELPRLAGEQQFEIGLAALADGLLNAAHRVA
jgi:TetR/AcrR family tetracycline transcriptional repressor